MTNMIYVENKNGYNQKNCTFHAFVGFISGHNSESKMHIVSMQRKIKSDR